MLLPEHVAIKFDLYTLACHELVLRWDDLYFAIQEDLRLTDEACKNCVGETLHRFFQRSAARSKQHAAKELCDLLDAEAALLFSSNANAAAIFGQAVEAIRCGIADWDARAHIERCHQQGRDLARAFYADSPWPATQERLDIECGTLFEYGASTDDDRRALVAESFGYRAAPMGYRATRWEKDDEQRNDHTVLLRFTFDHDLNLYVALPFLFLHEYTAHVYSTDYGNERFNDGWMLHAAAAYLKRTWACSAVHSDLTCAQASVFYDHLYPALNPIARRSAQFARDFENWLQVLSPERYTQFTHELAGFQPTPNQKLYWPTQFINALEREFLRDRPALLLKIEHATSARELMTALAET